MMFEGSGISLYFRGKSCYMGEEEENNIKKRLFRDVYLSILGDPDIIIDEKARNFGFRTREHDFFKNESSKRLFCRKYDLNGNSQPSGIVSFSAFDHATPMDIFVPPKYTTPKIAKFVNIGKILGNRILYQN